jgi:hypothetical protein
MRCIAFTAIQGFKENTLDLLEKRDRMRMIG